MPIISWAVPANRNESLFLWPSLYHCLKRLNWLPDVVVGDMAYIHLEVQKAIREKLKVTVLTKLRADMKMRAPFYDELVARCPQGQQLTWLGLEHRDQLHWFGVTQSESICQHCWEQSQCPRQFSFAPAEHEILLGQIPLASKVAKTLLEKVRPWIEPAQSYEKNQLGLSQMFLNSLFVTWVNCLLADAVVILRAHALLAQPPAHCELEKLLPRQMPLDLGPVDP